MHLQNDAKPSDTPHLHFPVDKQTFVCVSTAVPSFFLHIYNRVYLRDNPIACANAR